MVPLRSSLLLWAVAAVSLVPVLARPAMGSSSPHSSPSYGPTPSPSAVLGPGPGAPPEIDVVKVDGVIDRPVADYLLAALEDAEGRGDTVIVQLNTPGTLDVDPIALARRVFDSRVPVVVWVGPSGSHAMGGGLL